MGFRCERRRGRGKSETVNGKLPADPVPLRKINRNLNNKVNHTWSDFFVMSANPLLARVGRVHPLARGRVQQAAQQRVRARPDLGLDRPGMAILGQHLVNPAPKSGIDDGLMLTGVPTALVRQLTKVDAVARGGRSFHPGAGQWAAATDTGTGESQYRQGSRHRVGRRRLFLGEHLPRFEGRWPDGLRGPGAREQTAPRDRPIAVPGHGTNGPSPAGQFSARGNRASGSCLRWRFEEKKRGGGPNDQGSTCQPPPSAR